MKNMYILIFLCISFFSLESMEISSPRLECIDFSVVNTHIALHLNLSSMSKFLRTCKTIRRNCFYNPSVGKSIAALTEHDIEAIQVGTSGFLLKNTAFCRSLTIKEHLDAFVHYSWKHNKKIIQHLMIHEGDQNRFNRLMLLGPSDSSSDNIQRTIDAYQCRYTSVTADAVVEQIHCANYYTAQLFLKYIPINIVLHKAIWMRSVNAINCLINHGADIYSTDENGLSLLHILARDEKAWIDFLMAVGDAPYKEETLYTDDNNIHFMRWLIGRGLDVNKVDNKGRTPLHFAAFYYGTDDDCLELLIQSGAEINRKDNLGKTPYDYALMQQHEQSYDFFRRNNAEFTWDPDLLPKTDVIEF